MTNNLLVIFTLGLLFSMLIKDCHLLFYAMLGISIIITGYYVIDSIQLLGGEIEDFIADLEKYNMFMILVFVIISVPKQVVKEFIPRAG